METNNSIKKERIAKKIAQSGYCSRREAERLILEKKVAVNGAIITTPAFFVSEEDSITVNKFHLKEPQKTRLFIYYKPKGLICSYKDEENRETIFDDLKKYKDLPRLIYVGRLDYNSEGLLLLSNNGELSNILTSPKLELKRIYKVRVFGKVSQEELDKLSFGIELDGVQYKSIIANILDSSRGNMWIEFVIKEGKNREIRKICEYLNLQVNRLIRVSFGPYELEDLKEGELAEVEISRLHRILDRRVYEKLVRGE